MLKNRLLGLLLVLSCSTASATTFVGKLIDSDSNGYVYAYAPSIVSDGGLLHMFYCSTGSGANAWDAVRYSNSVDGVAWSVPEKILEVSGGINERAACDPSLVKFDRGDGEKYYLFYSGNIPGYETVMFVARANDVAGPYLKYTQRGTWESNPSDPKVILYPKKEVVTGWYGAGEQTVVSKDGRLYSWYMDDTESYPSERVAKIYFSSTTDPVAWPTGQQTNVQSTSVDVKLDPVSNLFVMYAVEPHHGEDSHLVIRKSEDGLRWWEGARVCEDSCFPDHSHNVGVGGNVRGHLDGRYTLVAYGAPYDLDPTCGHNCTNWDLYGHFVETNPASFVVPLIFNALSY